MNNTSALRRIWLLTAQVIAIGAGLLIAWRAFGPVPAAAPVPSVVAVREAAPPASRSASFASASAVTAGLEAGFRGAARKASASVVNIYTRKTPPQRPQGRWQPYGDSEQEPRQGQASLGSGVIVAAQGYILTNNHVIDGAAEIAVMLPGAALVGMLRGGPADKAGLRGGQPATITVELGQRPAARKP